MTGHDYSYVRTHPFKSNYSTVATGSPLVTNGITIDQNNLGNDLLNPAGIVYMCLDSSTGSKYYGLHTPTKATSKVENQNNKPEYTACFSPFHSIYGVGGNVKKRNYSFLSI